MVYTFQHFGKIPLADCTIIEDPGSDIFFFDEDSKCLLNRLSVNYWQALNYCSYLIVSTMASFELLY